MCITSSSSNLSLTGSSSGKKSSYGSLKVEAFSLETKRHASRFAVRCWWIVTMSLLGIVLLLLSSSDMTYPKWKTHSPLSLKVHHVFHPSGDKDAVESSSADEKVTVLLPTDHQDVVSQPSNLYTKQSSSFSMLDPVGSLNILSYNRSQETSPSKTFGKLRYSHESYPFPTNRWYENMLTLPDDQDLPNRNNHVYTLPYLVDASGPIAGIRLFATDVLAMERIVQLTFVDSHGLTIGASRNLAIKSSSIGEPSQQGNTMHSRYTVYDEVIDEDEGLSPLTPLGFTLKWDPIDANASAPLKYMSTSIVRGMPYGTMHYHYDTSSDIFEGTVPTVASEIDLHQNPIIDSNIELKCSNDDEGSSGTVKLVKKSVTLTFMQSDSTWLVFYSHPVYVRCYQSTSKAKFVLQVVRLAKHGGKLTGDSVSSPHFSSRIALVNNCTSGTNPTYCELGVPHDRSALNTILHDHAHVYPGMKTDIDYSFLSDDSESDGNDNDMSHMTFDWDARHIKTMQPIETQMPNSGDAEVLMYALPHHIDSLVTNASHFDADSVGESHCTPSLNGRSCIVKGSRWTMKEDLGAKPSFYAARQPITSAIPNLAKAVMKDIAFRLPDYYVRGAGDTYFSGKMLAKLSRILLITRELQDLCSKRGNVRIGDKEGIDECKNIEIPSDEQFEAALDHLRSSTEIWINGTAATPFVYDLKWKGLVSCGCHFNGDSQSCDNVFPDCPCFSDPGLDFGHGFYNDHHFHQGYHIYSAATVAYFDHDWGIKHFDDVLLLIRDIANPSTEDKYFPTFRMKDWYSGHSWAGGVAATYPNGRNQESSSEAIASYEAIALFGQVMMNVFQKDNDLEKVTISQHILNIGRLLTATELRSADRYWHVRQSGPEYGKIYPKQYKPLAVGIVWTMMAQFQTWFGNAPYLAYGIQLLPLTPVAEQRDDIEWMKQLYEPFSDSCHSTPDCDNGGWGVLLGGVLATIGHKKKAINYAESLSPDAFEVAGGNGHSLTNTIWYYATRPDVSEPLDIPTTDSSTDHTSQNPTEKSTPEQHNEKGDVFDCGCPTTCTSEVLDLLAGDHTCGDRIRWLMMSFNRTVHDACSRVAGVEFTDICAGCDPNRCIEPTISPLHETLRCPKCSKNVCEDKTLNRCPLHGAPFLCIDGVNKGGCSNVPWVISTTTCNKCCEVPESGCSIEG